MFARGIFHLCPISFSGFISRTSWSTKPLLTHSMLFPPPKLCDISSLVLTQKPLSWWLLQYESYFTLKHIILLNTNSLWPVQPGPSSSVCPHSTALTYNGGSVFAEIDWNDTDSVSCTALGFRQIQPQPWTFLCFLLVFLMPALLLSGSQFISQL